MNTISDLYLLISKKISKLFFTKEPNFSKETFTVSTTHFLEFPPTYIFIDESQY